MSEPYYKQEYQGERKLDGEAPVFSFGQIMKETFLTIYLECKNYQKKFLDWHHCK